MTVPNNYRIFTTWIMIVAILCLTGTCTAGIGTSLRLSHPKLSLKLRLEHTPKYQLINLTPISALQSSSKDSKSWVPRIVIPVAVVAVTATATYLIFSQRGG